MNRRNFIRSAGALSLPAFLPASLMAEIARQNNDRVLVLIRLSGGNDGLNTVIGLDQYANLTKVRSNLMLPEASLLRINDKTAFHPAMTGMQNLFGAGELGIVQGAGYPNQNRSHFRSTDIWSAGTDDQRVTSGWLGRYLDEGFPDYPVGYPNATATDPPAITMGGVVSATCQGDGGTFSQAVRDPFNFQFIAPGGDTPLPDDEYGAEVNYVRNLIGQSNEYGAVVQAAAERGNSLATYPDTNLGDQLRDIATMISGGLKTKIYVATVGSFDTHGNQVESGDTTTGEHAELLRNLSDSMAAFVEDMKMLSLSDRVIGMTFSEFGRRIRSNQSNGSDHGTAAPLFLFGQCVNAGILGESPEIDPEVSQNEGVPMQYDFRDVYGSVLMDWFKIAKSRAESVLRDSFTYLPLASGCNAIRPYVFSQLVVLEGGDAIELKWETDTAIFGGDFRIERSRDGQNFAFVGKRGANSAAAADNHYSFVDRNVAEGERYYYRIHQTTVDQPSALSQVVTGQLSDSPRGEWAVGLPRPNPVGPTSFVQVYAPRDANANFELFNVDGRRVRTGSVNLIGGRDNRLPLRANDLPAGHYVWRLTTDDGKQFSRKVIR